jgi:elongation factor Ts
MQITAALVKELRERTGAGMMECKKTLVETNGDIEAAVEAMRKSGLAAADKKAGRVAAEGIVAIAVADDGRSAAMAEVNCETDFVAKQDEFQSFAEQVARTALASGVTDPEALAGTTLDGASASVEDRRRELIATIGEKIDVRRATIVDGNGVIGSYSHGGRIGVVVTTGGDDEALARDIAMHVAASKPLCVSEDEVPSELLEKERAIYEAQANESGKPAEIVEKMVTGRVGKFIRENTLLGQPFVKDPDMTVQKLLAGKNASVGGFVRYEVGEGIERKEENFAEEVMAQVRDSAS